MSTWNPYKNYWGHFRSFLSEVFETGMERTVGAPLHLNQPHFRCQEPHVTGGYHAGPPVSGLTYSFLQLTHGTVYETPSSAWPQGLPPVAANSVAKAAKHLSLQLPSFFLDLTRSVLALETFAASERETRLHCVQWKYREPYWQASNTWCQKIYAQILAC